MYESNEALDSAGHSVPLRENVAPEFATALYRAVLNERPSEVVEVGMAYGATSLAILTALKTVGAGGRLTTIDPYQRKEWKGIGILNVERAGLGSYHTMIEDFDYLALPRLIEGGVEIDFAYVDGRHNFEYALLDFFYIDKMLRRGGVVGFNDCDWLPVRAVLRFVRRHRQYERIDVGLDALYGDRAPWTRVVRRVDRRLTRGRATDTKAVGSLLGRRREDQYWRKIGTGETPHGYWAPL
jgi:predicted O-methyltransferase YrrM